MALPVSLASAGFPNVSASSLARTASGLLPRTAPPAEAFPALTRRPLDAWSIAFDVTLHPPSLPNTSDDATDTAGKPAERVCGPFSARATSSARPPRSLALTSAAVQTGAVKVAACDAESSVPVVVTPKSCTAREMNSEAPSVSRPTQLARAGIRQPSNQQSDRTVRGGRMVSSEWASTALARVGLSGRELSPHQAAEACRLGRP
jgi:hypothetical protein